MACWWVVHLIAHALAKIENCERFDQSNTKLSNPNYEYSPSADQNFLTFRSLALSIQERVDNSPRSLSCGNFTSGACHPRFCVCLCRRATDAAENGMSGKRWYRRCSGRRHTSVRRGNPGGRGSGYRPVKVKTFSAELCNGVYLLAVCPRRQVGTQARNRFVGFFVYGKLWRYLPNVAAFISKVLIFFR